MTLDPYRDFIVHLPYLDQAFETKKATWQQQRKLNTAFSEFYKKCFKKSNIKLSRRDIFSACCADFNEALFSIILWGYPRNMRGNNFAKILSSLSLIRDTLIIEKNLSEADFLSICSALKKTGMGLSTLTKILYFFEYTLEGYQCLIFDSRIIQVVNDENGFSELKKLISSGRINEFNKEKKYVAYLRLMSEIAHTNQYKADQLELFLFAMGNNLKQRN